MKLIVWMIQEIFKMLNQYAVDIPTLPVNLCLSHLILFPGGMLSRSIGRPSRREGRPDIWNTHGISGNVFVNPPASSSAPYPHESNPWVSNTSEHTPPHVRSGRQIPDTALDPRCQPEIHSSLVREDFQIIIEQTNNDCGFRILISTNSQRQQHSLVGR